MINRILVAILIISVSVNGVMFAVLVDDDIYEEQQQFAIQYLGGRVNDIEPKISMLRWYKEANENLIQHCDPCTLNKAIKATPLPPRLSDVK